jgi:hypothetical protein
VISFLEPLVLVGLAAAAIPTLLHLIGRRQPPTVIFPAVRYLSATEREHSRRLKLRNLLLLILRTLVIVLVVLGAARPVARIAGGSSHPPTAVAVVVDNSLSSGAVVGGRRILDSLVLQARRAVERTTPQDRLWLVVADGAPRRVGRAELVAALDSLRVWPVRMDVGAAVRAVAGVIADDPLPGKEVVVFSDLQASALSAGDDPGVRVLAWHPPDPPENRGIDSAFAQPARWSPDGAVVAAVGGSAQGPAAVLLTVAGAELARAVAAPGDRVVLSGNAPRRGWLRGVVELDPDELRADDRRWLALHAATPTAAMARPGAGAFIGEASAVLQEGGRIVVGSTVVLDDQVADSTTILFPPSDPSLVGAVNRALNARGVDLEFADLLDGEWELTGDVGLAAGTPIYRRYRVQGSGVVVAEVGGEPWLVRGNGVVIVASRMEDDWTPLPVGAAFVPFVDFLINRLAVRERWIARASPGAPVVLPPPATAVVTPAGALSVPSDRRVTAPGEAGVYFLQGTAGDTVGALEVNHDPRESQLTPASQRVLRAALGGDAERLSGRAFERALFRGTRRADLTGVLIAAAIIAALTELAIGSAGTGRREIRDAAAAD